MPNCRDCKHFWKDVDLPHPVCRLHQFHFQNNFTPCDQFDSATPSAYASPASTPSPAYTPSSVAPLGYPTPPTEKTSTGTIVAIIAVVVVLIGVTVAGWLTDGFGLFDEESPRRSSSRYNREDKDDKDNEDNGSVVEAPTTSTTTYNYDADIVSGNSYIAVVVSPNGLNLRQHPNTEATILTAVTHRSRVTVFYSRNNWSYVEYNGKRGWCSTEFLIDEDLMTTTAPTTQKTFSVPPGTAKITSDNGINLREGPGTNYKVIVAMPYNATVNVQLSQNGWCYVEYKGKTGWCTAEFLEAVR